MGKAARNWKAHDAIVKALINLEVDETLIIQSGKPIGILKTHELAPKVIMANCNMIWQWAKVENLINKLITQVIIRSFVLKIKLLSQVQTLITSFGITFANFGNFTCAH